jgi:hypothetical protein
MLQYEDKRKRHEALVASLELERTSFMSHWRDLAEYMWPRRVRIGTNDQNKGDKRNQKIINNVATRGLRTLRSGMMAGITSPARPWFRLTTPDPDLSEAQAVKEWLDVVTNRMRVVIGRSNAYNKLPQIYGDLGGLGTAALLVVEDFENVIHTEVLPVGSFCAGNDAKGRVRVLTREFNMTIRQIVEEFCEVQVVKGCPKIVSDNVSDFIKDKFEKQELETWIVIQHIIEPNPEYNPKSLHAKHKQFSSCYYEKSSNEYLKGKQYSKYLRESGFDRFRVLVPRWERTGEDVYGTDCPGMMVLGDVKQLQHMEKRKAQGIDKMIMPPMTAPTSLQNRKVSQLPGDVTFVNVREGQQGLRPINETNPRLAELNESVHDIEARIEKGLFVDLFLMLANSDRREITAREIDERHEEKLLALGPVLEQLNQDLLDPFIDIIYEIMEAQDMIPEIPEELNGVPLKIEYISIMAQAQKLVGIAGIERLAGFIGQIAGFDPGVMDKANTDQWVDDYADALGTAPKLVRSDDQVAEIRAQKQKAQQAQAQAQMIQQGSVAAKNLSQTDLQSDNALKRIIDESQAGGLGTGVTQ